jgi:hypothetical protein
MTRQRGQSMTEFAVGMTVMALMLLGSITIAMYQEMQRRTSIAARQGAFQSAWTGSRDGYSTVLRRAAELQLEDSAVVDAMGHRYVGASDISVAGSIQPAPGRAQGAAHAMIDPLRVAGGFLGGGFDLSTRGLLVGSIGMNIPPNPRLPEPFAGISVQLQQPLAVMTDAWNASGASHVRDRASGLVPTTLLSDLQMLWRPLLAPLALIEPSLSRLCLGIIEADRVPEDRLGSGRTALPGRCP